jgi:hypothetical protein
MQFSLKVQATILLALLGSVVSGNPNVFIPFISLTYEQEITSPDSTSTVTTGSISST